ncbi:unnamed protein product [Adineta ricciae]|uniref:F-box domain-containing protein n=1 Tax=Adineta ricciae TaxID=249248 RepID=A0A814KIF6_ADIRI|nr:unnamed protein product [Adineta ricciae]
MISTLEDLPNELFVHELFRYMSLIDLNYEFFLLNERFRTLIKCFSAKKRYHIHLTHRMTLQQSLFTIDYILPTLSEHQQLKSVQLNDVDLFLRLINNSDKINMTYLNTMIVTSFIDIQFSTLRNLVSKCPQLRELKLGVMTNTDSSWADGRKWIQWFEILRGHENRQNILQILDICVWCINPNHPINFHSRFWIDEGVYRDNRCWRVRIKPEHLLTWRQSRRSLECSRSDQDYVSLLYPKANSTCTLI